MTLAFAPNLPSQSSAASQILTLQVQELNSMLVAGPKVRFQFEREPTDEQRATASSTFIWTSNADSRKMAVSCQEASPAGKLRISIREGLSTIGIVKAEIELVDPTPLDLIRAAEKSAGSCTVEFSVTLKRSMDREKKMMAVLYTITSG